MNNKQRKALMTWMKWKTRDIESVLMLSLKTAFKPKIDRYGQHDLLGLDKPNSWLELFLHRLNQKIFKSAFLQKRKRLEVISVYELDHESRYHFHCLVNNPIKKNGEAFSFPEMEKLSRHTWERTEHAKLNDGFDLQKIYSARGKEYVFKFKKGLDKENVAWQNTYIAC